MKKLHMILPLIAFSLSANAQSLSGEFDKIDVSGVYEVILTHGEECSVEVVCSDKKFEDQIKMKIKNNTLILGLKREGEIKNKTKKSKKHGIIAYISMADISAVRLSGVTDLSSDHIFTTDTFECKVGGVSSMKLGIDCNQIRIDASGVSTAKLWGRAKNATIEASGVSSVNCKEMVIENGNVEVSGVSKVESNINHVKDVDVSGMSKYKNHL